MFIVFYKIFIWSLKCQIIKAFFLKLYNILQFLFIYHLLIHYLFQFLKILFNLITFIVIIFLFYFFQQAKGINQQNFTLIILYDRRCCVKFVISSSHLIKLSFLLNLLFSHLVETRLRSILRRF